MKQSRRHLHQLIAHERILREAVTKNPSSALIEKLYDIRDELRSRGYVIITPTPKRPMSQRNKVILRRAVVLLVAVITVYVWAKWPQSKATIEEVELTPQQRIDQAFDALKLHARGFREESK